MHSSRSTDYGGSTRQAKRVGAGPVPLRRFLSRSGIDQQRSAHVRVAPEPLRSERASVVARGLCSSLNFAGWSLGGVITSASQSSMHGN